MGVGDVDKKFSTQHLTDCLRMYHFLKFLKLRSLRGRKRFMTPANIPHLSEDRLRNHSEDMTTSPNRPTLEQLKPRLRQLLSTVYPDWPRKGVLFRDIMPLFQHPDVVRDLAAAIADHCRSLKKPIDAVAGLEARGFLFGPMVAVELNVPFIPIRKKGKLPGEVLASSYLKEYGPDTLEIQKSAIKPGANVFIVDDLLATAGTMKSGIDLVRQAGGNVVEAFCLIELVDLKGKLAFPDGIQFYSVLEF